MKVIGLVTGRVGIFELLACYTRHLAIRKSGPGNLLHRMYLVTPSLAGTETNRGLSTGKAMQSSRSARNFADDLLLAAAGLLTLWYAAPCCSTCGRRHLAVDGNGPSGTAPAEGASA